MVRLSALGTVRLYLLENITGTHFCKRLSQPQGHSASGRFMSIKNSSDTIGNRTRDLPVFTVVPHRTAPVMCLGCPVFRRAVLHPGSGWVNLSQMDTPTEDCDSRHKFVCSFRSNRTNYMGLERTRRPRTEVREVSFRAVFLNRRAAARYRGLASLIPGRERFYWNLSF